VDEGVDPPTVSELLIRNVSRPPANPSQSNAGVADHHQCAPEGKGVDSPNFGAVYPLISGRNQPMTHSSHDYSQECVVPAYLVDLVNVVNVSSHSLNN